uniref:Uncharacterized protein n=1 Tax=Vitis vinifera TaxID=29760 RepID=F6HSD5_VITVI
MNQKLSIGIFSYPHILQKLKLRRVVVDQADL